jgi:hypothetical protein
MGDGTVPASARARAELAAPVRDAALGRDERRAARTDQFDAIAYLFAHSQTLTWEVSLHTHKQAGKVLGGLTKRRAAEAEIYRGAA